MAFVRRKEPEALCVNTVSLIPMRRPCTCSRAVSQASQREEHCVGGHPSTVLPSGSLQQLGIGERLWGTETRDWHCGRKEPCIHHSGTTPCLLPSANLSPVGNSAATSECKPAPCRGAREQRKGGARQEAEGAFPVDMAVRTGGEGGTRPQPLTGSVGPGSAVFPLATSGSHLPEFECWAGLLRGQGQSPFSSLHLSLEEEELGRLSTAVDPLSRIGNC